jgi:DNA processing protein
VAEGGAVVSELPLESPPRAENFPARNRIISGLSLGVLVIEAGRRSGALITARLAAEEHGREVFALPARVDSLASEGSLDLIKKGGAALVTSPRDIIDALESPARHHFDGTHEAVTADPTRESAPLLDFAGTGRESAGGRPPELDGLSESQRSILAALVEPKTLDELTRVTGVEPGRLRAELTVLEVRRRIRRQGTWIAAVK